MIRKCWLFIGVVSIKFEHLRNTLKQIYYKNLYNKQLQHPKSFRFPSQFDISLSPDSKLIIAESCCFSPYGRIETLKKALIKIGSGVYFNRHCSIVAMEKITIGENCLFGENVKIYDHNHRFKSDSLIKDQGYKTAQITIGSNVWVGSNVTILKGVTVGDNSVIGAGCIISEYIPANHVVSMQPGLSIEPISS